MKMKQRMVEENIIGEAATALRADEVKRTLRHYVKFHLKPGDLEKVPELAAFLDE